MGLTPLYLDFACEYMFECRPQIMGRNIHNICSNYASYAPNVACVYANTFIINPYADSKNRAGTPRLARSSNTMYP